MEKTVEELQNAFQSIVKTLKRNNKVLAIFTFGSIVSGDVWEESDIDLFVVYKNEFNELRDVYSKILEIPVHTKLLCKDKFMELYKNDGKRGFIRNLLTKSKIVFSRDDDISEAYNKARYSNDIHIERWNLVYLGLILKDMKVCKKYFQNGGLNTSYEVLIRILDSFSKLYININGYSKTKASVAMASNLNGDIKILVQELFAGDITRCTMEKTIKYIEEYIGENILISSKLVLEYLQGRGGYVSSFEMLNEGIFKGFDISIEDILEELSKRRLIQKDKRILKDSEGIKVMHENVYFANKKR